MAPNPETIDMNRTFDAPVSALYNLCSSPAFFKHCGAATATGLFDFRVGGRYDFEIGSDDYIRGEFKEIIPREKIVFSWSTNTEHGPCNDTTVTLLLSEQGKGSRLRIIHEGFVNEGARESHNEGWAEIFGTVADRFNRELQNFLSDQLKIRFKVKQTFKKPPSEVFDAFITPELLQTFFVTKASGPLEEGKLVEWTFKGWDDNFKVHCTKVVKNELIEFSWGQTHVQFVFEPVPQHGCKLTIGCEGWALNQDSLDDSYAECEGWRDVLCQLKARLEHDIEL